MNVQTRPGSAEFDQNNHLEIVHGIGACIQQDALVLAETAMRFARVERVPRYDPDSRENNAEHSFMLGLIAQELSSQYFPDLNSGLVTQFALVHDLLELKTGDIATFSLTDEELQNKTTNEHAVLDEICDKLPATTALLLRVYEQQALPEARFVRFVDKLLPVLVDILGPGSQVMHEDYNTFNHEQLEECETALRIRFESMFPEPELASMHIARNGLARIFSVLFVPLPQLQNSLF